MSRNVAAAQRRLPRLPVRDAAHLDGCIDRCAECAGVEQRLGGADRLVITHVLIHCQDDARGFARLHCPLRVGVVHGERLLPRMPFTVRRRHAWLFRAATSLAERLNENDRRKRLAGKVSPWMAARRMARKAPRSGCPPTACH